MPDYKKKKHSAFGAKRKKEPKENVQENIKMSPKGEPEGPPVKVVRGKKPNYKKRFTVLGAIAAAVLLFVIIFK